MYLSRFDESTPPKQVPSGTFTVPVYLPSLAPPAVDRTRWVRYGYASQQDRFSRHGRLEFVHDELTVKLVTLRT